MRSPSSQILKLLHCFCAFSLIAAGSASAIDADVAIENVTVIDATGAAPRSGQNVLIKDGIITLIGVDPIADATTIIDGSGKFLIPGLWDMHVHWTDFGGAIPQPEDYLGLFIANGVTGIRMMSGETIHYQWKARVGEKEFVAPRMLIGSNIIDGPNKIWPWSHAATTEDEGREFVRQNFELGADFIKVYDEIHLDVYLAIADEAKKLGIPILGHVPIRVDVEVASDAGLKGIEHITGINLALSNDRDAIRESYVASTTSIDDSADFADESSQHIMELRKRARESYDPSMAPALFERLKQNGTWQTPTLTVLRNVAHIREMGEASSERLSFMPPMFGAMWDPSGDPLFQNYSDEDWNDLEQMYEWAKLIVGDMNRSGVRIIAGTDVLNPFCFPGFSLHDELELLVEAGLSTMQALQAATRNSAEFSDMENTLGTIEVGKIADLVLLNENPIEDIRNTTKIATVIFNGQVRNRENLDAVLAQIRAKASEGGSN